MAKKEFLLKHNKKKPEVGGEANQFYSAGAIDVIYKYTLYKISTFSTPRVIRTETNLKHSERARNFFATRVGNLATERVGGRERDSERERSIGSRLCVLFVVWFVAVANET